MRMRLFQLIFKTSIMVCMVCVSLLGGWVIVDESEVGFLRLFVPLLVVIVMLLRRNSCMPLWAIVAGIYGLLFGTLCSVPYFITGGWAAGIAYIVAGLSFDLTHCIGNVASVVILFIPLDRILKRCLKH